jgi:hypothetical protein
MKSGIHTKRLNNLLAGIQKSIDLFEGQGYTDVYFTAQFLRGGKKQNGIERGDVGGFLTQIRAYVKSEEADTVKLDFIDERTGKSIYSKSLTGLRNESKDEAQPKSSNGGNGLGGFNGLGEAEFNRLVDQRVEVKERNNEFIRIKQENEALRSRNETLTEEKEELTAEIKAKKDLEYYMGIVGTVFPGLSALFQGTRIANVATMLAGTTDVNGNALPAAQTSNDSETQSIAAMVSEFCNTLSVQEAGIVHLLFMAFEKDRSQMQRALQFISQTPATT